jgi:Tol biopolymer transport system component
MTRFACLLLLRTIIGSFVLLWLSLGLASGQSTPPLSPPHFAGGWWERGEEILSTAIPFPHATTDLQEARATMTANAINRADDWWLLAFQSRRDGNWEIYRNTVTGANPTRLTYQPANDTAPQISPDASKIVFVSDRDGNDELYVMQADGSNQLRLTTSTHNERMPVWSPDGAQIAFVSYQRGNADIYVMNADGSNQRTLTREVVADLFPSWSPDGSRLVFVRASNNEYGKLWVMNGDGSNATAITGDLRYLSHPRWSPDGNTIAFDYDGTNDYFNELGVVNADGANLRQLNRTGGLNTYEEFWAGAWTPDSKELLYSYIHYDRQGNRLVLFDLRLGRFCVESGPTLCNPVGTIANLDHAPDVRSLDKWSPVSQVNPLPAYTRQQDLYISWSGYDIGPSGIAGYTTQYRPTTSAEWSSIFLPSTYDTGAFLNYPAGSKLYFRSHAYDNAGNIEAWPSGDKGDTETTLYVWSLSGQLTDMRGIVRANQGIALQPAALEPVQTNQFGHFQVRLPNDGLYLLNNQSELDMQSDRQRTLYLLPGTNLIQNGGFETRDLSGWQGSDQESVGITFNDKSSGAAAVRLGPNCGGACLNKLETPLGGRSINQSFLVAAPDDTLHLLGIQNSQTLLYTQRTATGQWSPAVPLYNGSAGVIQAALDGQGGLHAVWQSFPGPNGTEEINYSYRSVAGSWSTPSVIAQGAFPRLAADRQGGLHLLYRCNIPTCPTTKLWHRYRSAAGAWGEPTLLDESTTTLMLNVNYALAIGMADRLHLVWVHTENNSAKNAFYYRERAADGRWSSTLNLTQKTGARPADFVQLYADAQGALHLFWPLYYLTRSVDGIWSVPEMINNGFTGPLNYAATLDGQGTLHLLMSNKQGAGIYRYKPVGQSWSDPRSSGMNSQSAPQFAITAGSANALYASRANFMSGVTLQSTVRATTTMTSTLRQALTLPADLHQPTLAFLYTLEGGAGASALTVHISSTATPTPTQVFSATATVPWSLGWADLSPWAGQPVTVTFGIQQAAIEPLLRIQLDDISVGAWTTPAPQTITPAQVEVGATATFTITGQNFSQTPTVQLGNTSLTNVRRLDEQTLQADLPAGIGPGRYDLWVTNPSGEATVLTSAVQVGKPLYLPVIAR